MHTTHPKKIPAPTHSLICGSCVTGQILYRHHELSHIPTVSVFMFPNCYHILQWSKCIQIKMKSNDYLHLELLRNAKVVQFSQNFTVQYITYIVGMCRTETLFRFGFGLDFFISESEPVWFSTILLHTSHIKNYTDHHSCFVEISCKVP